MLASANEKRDANKRGPSTSGASRKMSSVVSSGMVTSRYKYAHTY